MTDKVDFVKAVQDIVRRKSVARVIRTFAAQLNDLYRKTLREATEEEVLAVILKWILEKLPPEEGVVIRARDSEGNVFEVRIQKHHSCGKTKHFQDDRRTNSET